MKKRASMMRFMDVSDDPVYITVYLDGARYGFFHRTLKKHFTDDTTILPSKDRLYEIKFVGQAWHNINRTEFMLRLSSVNAWRKEKDMPVIVMPEIKNEDDN